MPLVGKYILETKYFHGVSTKVMSLVGVRRMHNTAMCRSGAVLVSVVDRFTVVELSQAITPVGGVSGSSGNWQRQCFLDNASCPLSHLSMSTVN